MQKSDVEHLRREFINALVSIKERNPDSDPALILTVGFETCTKAILTSRTGTRDEMLTLVKTIAANHDPAWAETRDPDEVTH